MFPLHSSSSAELAAHHEVDDAVTEALRLIARHDCHQGRNDLMALQLQQALCHQGSGYDSRSVELCLKRLRLSAETGKYPTELL
jgi:hypothetical protein